ncbi:peptidase MA family protein [Leptospira wolffii]|uniref:peptidase MA family protein n=1 Tax=Leptospira wolffii TaxID=409998 RepID=UPI0002F0C006|nr:peptidase MA family protein [Leptospira wolffii]EPG66011.1 peptidase MA family protein [Leptospira wolffii serovar Khorat str. Khorat-H2]
MKVSFKKEMQTLSLVRKTRVGRLVGISKFFLFVFFLSHCVGQNVFQSDDKTEPNLSDLLSLSRLSSSCSGASSFWIRNLVTNSSACTQTQLMSSGTHVKVYASAGLENAIDYNYIAQEFDTKIYPRLGDAFGYSDDLDGDGKVTVIVTNIIDGSQPGGSFVAGFFDPVDYFPDSSSYSVRSNYSNIVYMDGVELVELRTSDMTAGKPDTFLATLAHEYQHLIRFQYEARILTSNGGRDEAWINEGTSEVASDIAGYSPQISRINCYRGRNSNSCARGANGSTVFGSSKFNTLVDYAFAYSFMKYLYMISGSTTSERNAYFRSGVQGPKGYRASDALGLFQLFRSNATGYTNAPQGIKDLLGSSSATSFQKIYPTFIWQSLGETLPDSGQMGTDTSGGTAFLDGMNQLIQYYPFPLSGEEGGELRKLYNPLRIPEITPLSQLTPGQIQLVKADRSNAGSTSNLVLFKKVWDGAQYSLQINTDARKSGDISVSLGITESEDEGEEAISLPESSGVRAVCPHEFFKLSRTRTKLKPISIF